MFHAPMSVAPWMFECPRCALMPPPGMPILPSMSCSIAAVWISCTEWLCCVQPSAYRMVPWRSGAAVEQITAAAFSNSAAEQPQIGGHHLRRVPRVVLLHQLEHRSRMLQRRIDLRVT